MTTLLHLLIAACALTFLIPTAVIVILAINAPLGHEDEQRGFVYDHRE